MESNHYTNNHIEKSSSNKLLTGVCAGLSNYFNIDLSFLRFLFIIFTFLSLSSVILYILFSAILPDEKLDLEEELPEDKSENHVAIFASVFLLLAVILLINYFNVPLFINIWSISFIFSLAIFFLLVGLILASFFYLKVEINLNLDQIKRTKSDKLISGLIGGLSHFFYIDSHLLRIIIVSISIFLIKLLPLFLIIYLLFTILLPYESEGSS